MCVHVACIYAAAALLKNIYLFVKKKKKVFSRNNAICECNSLRYGVLLICYSIFIR